LPACSVLDVFNDDFAFGPFESSSGFVDHIQIYNTTLTDPKVISGVPEALSRAMMIAGFGLVGAAMRRRVSALA